MELLEASRGEVKIKMALEGPNNTGKTYSALLIAYGLCNEWTKIAVIDTEHRSSNLYSYFGKFRILPLCAPFTTERYNQAITTCEKQGMEVIIIDSISHQWAGTGGILDIHAALPGNSFKNWRTVNVTHNNFLDRILESPVHIICTIRSKQDYIMIEKEGKLIPEKVGLKPVTRNDVEFEFSLVFKLNMKNKALATKDRTQLFLNKPEFILTQYTGLKIRQWCQEGIKEEIQKPI